MKQEIYVSSIDSMCSQNYETRDFRNMEHPILKMGEVVGLWKYNRENYGK